MEFTISVYHINRSIRLKVKRIYESEQIEKFEVSGKNRSIVLQSNRPLLSKLGLGKKKIKWQLAEGSLNNISLLEKIIAEVEGAIKNTNKPGRYS